MSEVKAEVQTPELILEQYKELIKQDKADEAVTLLTEAYPEGVEIPELILEYLATENMPKEEAACKADA